LTFLRGIDRKKKEDNVTPFYDGVRKETRERKPVGDELSPRRFL